MGDMKSMVLDKHPQRGDTGKLAGKKFIGYWKSKYDPGLPDVNDFVDETWTNGIERIVVTDYLSRGEEISRARGMSNCRVCGKMNGSTEMTDGEYVWPEGLAHYVRDHSVRPPSDLIEKALAAANNTKKEKE